MCIRRWDSPRVPTKPAPVFASTRTPPPLLSSPPSQLSTVQAHFFNSPGFRSPLATRPAPLWTPLILSIAVPRRIWVTDRAETPAPRAAVLAQVEENHRGQRRVRQPLRLGVRAARVLFRRPRPLSAPGPGQVVEPCEAPRLSRLLGACSILLLVHPLASWGPRRSEEGERRPSEEVSSSNRGTPAGEHVGGSRELAEPPGGTVQPCSPCPQGHAARGAPGRREAPPGESPASPGFPGAPRLASRLPLTLFRLLRFAPRLRLPELALPSAKQSPRDGEKKGPPGRGQGSGKGRPLFPRLSWKRI